MNVEDVRI